MSLIHVYKTLNEKTTYNFTGRISDHLPDINYSNAVILRGGYRVGPEYVVKDDDIIFIRIVPTSAVAWTVGGLALALIIGGVAAGIALYKQQEELAALEASATASSTSTTKLPFIKGASNSAATGRTVPLCIGESLMTPYYLTSPHYTISGTKGENQYYNVVFIVGYNDVLIEKIKMGETTIKTFSDTEPQNGQYSWDDGTYYDENNLIEIRQTGDFDDDEFNKKIVLTEVNEEIPHEHASDDEDENEEITEEWEAGVVEDLADNAKSVEVIVCFDGLEVYDSDASGWAYETITLQPQWSNADDPTEDDWYDFDNGFNQNGTYSNTFTYKTSTQMRFSAVQEFTAAQSYGKSMHVRLRRTTPKAESNAKDTVYLVAVQTTCYDTKESTSDTLVTAPLIDDTLRDKTCRIGIRVTANENTDDQLDAFSVIEEAVARTWDGSAWSTEKTPTRNLAAWVLEILTSGQHTPSQYDDSELDLDSLGAMYEYCEEQGFNADGVITSATTKKKLLETLCGNANTSLVYNKFTGLMEAVIDNGRDYSVALLNSENIISISSSKEFSRKTDGKKVTYVNSAEDWESDSVVFMRDGEDYDPTTDTISETALEYVTDYEHAYKIVWRAMAQELAQPRTVTVKVGPEAAYYPIYSRVELQHQTLKNGIAHGVIKSVTYQNSLLKTITLDGPVTFPSSGACGVIVNCVSDSGRGLLCLKVSGSGTTDTLTVTTELASTADLVPGVGNILSFGKLDSDGEFTTVSNTMLITNAEETDSGYTLTLTDYNADIYEYGTLPTYHSNITKVPTSKAQTIESQRVYVTEGEVEATASGATQAAVDAVTKGTKFSSVYKIKDVSLTLEDIIARMDDDAVNASASISMSADEILLQVESLDEQQRALIALTKEQILEEVDDLSTELTGKIAIQAGAVEAIVEGGGTSGQMSLSLNLPILINAETRAELVTASSEDEVAAVYALVENSTYYGIRSDASDDDIKTLWDAAVDAGLLASQIVLSADQIEIAGKTIYTSSKSDGLITDAIATAAEDATAKTETALATALSAADSAEEAAETTAETNRQALITALSEDATEGNTVIDGGYLKTALIDVENLLVKRVYVKDKGCLTSYDYDGTVSDAGEITAYGSTGWALDNAGNSDFVNVHATGGTFTDVTVSGQIQTSKGVIAGNHVDEAATSLYGSSGDVSLSSLNTLFADKVYTADQVYMCNGTLVLWASKSDYYELNISGIKKVDGYIHFISMARYVDESNHSNDCMYLMNESWFELDGSTVKFIIQEDDTELTSIVAYLCNLVF